MDPVPVAQRPGARLEPSDYCTVTTTSAACDTCGEALVAVTVNVYLPAGVPPVSLPPLLLLAPPQLTPATRSTRTTRVSPATRRRRRDGTPNRKTPTSRLLPAAAHPNRPGRSSEVGMSERTCGALVETVSVAVPEPLATEFGLNVQEGDGVAAGAIVLQDRLTLALNPGSMGGE